MISNHKHFDTILPLKRANHYPLYFWSTLIQRKEVNFNSSNDQYSTKLKFDEPVDFFKKKCIWYCKIQCTTHLDNPKTLHEMVKFCPVSNLAEILWFYTLSQSLVKIAFQFWLLEWQQNNLDARHQRILNKIH